jgi:hypothetical protein
MPRVPNLAHPEGNINGVTNLVQSAGKWVQLQNRRYPGCNA